MKLLSFLLIFPQLWLYAQANVPLDLTSSTPEQVEEMILISYEIQDDELLDQIFPIFHSYVVSHPNEENLNEAYRQRIENHALKEKLTDCADYQARDFANRVIDDAITVGPCQDCQALEPLDPDFTEFAEQIVANLDHVNDDANTIIQNEFVEVSVTSAAENLAQLEYLTNPNATADSIFNKICGDENTNGFVNFFTGATKYTACPDEISPTKIKRAIQNKLDSLEGQQRYQLPNDQQEILQELALIVNELNQLLEGVTATIRPLTDMNGNTINSPLRTFGPQMALQLDDGSFENYQRFLQVFYQRTSTGIGSLLLSSNIVSTLPSIEISNFGIGATSDFRESDQTDPWGNRIFKLLPLPTPNNIAEIRDDIENSIRESAQELKDLVGENLSPREIGKYVATNPMNLAKVLNAHPELSNQVCQYINWAQAYSDRREKIDSNLQSASRWIGIGGAALSLIAGPLGAVPACIIGATAGTLATATSGAVLLRKIEHLQNLSGSYIAGGGDQYTIPEIINAYDQVSAQALETLVELGFTVFDFIQLGHALRLSRTARLASSVDDLVVAARRMGIKSKEELVDFASYVRKAKGPHFNQFSDLPSDFTDAFKDMQRISDDVRLRSIERADQFRSNWRSGDLDQAIQKFVGDSPVITTTDTGKIIYTNPEGNIRIVHDYHGEYFRIEDLTTTGRRSYLDLNGEIPNNTILPDGKTIGNNQATYNSLTHFKL